MSRRKVPPKATYTFSNGVTVALERVGPLFALPIQRANPAPAPPLAPGVGGMLEPNPADPDYEATLAAHNQKLALIIQEALLDMGIAEDIEIDQAAVDRIRQGYQRIGITMPETDRMLYIKYVCISNQIDLEGLFSAIRNYDVSEEAIRAAEDMFPSNGVGAAAFGDAEDPAEVQAALLGDRA